VVAGNDEYGTFYGVQTLLQLLNNKDVYECEIVDFPNVLDRGVVEGFYGNPFSKKDRESQFDFYSKVKMNTYIYGPKDDPYHGFGTKWREEYPKDKAQEIKELINYAHKNKVKFVWAVHPGNNINWTLQDSLATIKKFEAMYKLGVRAFAVFFDDISGIGTDPVRQANYMNYLQHEFADKKSDVDPLILCPTQYNQSWSSGTYLDTLGVKMDERIRIMWTGKSVVRMIDKQTMDWINNRIKRNAYIWLNYPVNDYVIDHLLMGPFVGNGTDIAEQLGGFVSNPMEYAEASKVALFSIADYVWNMKGYNADESWNAAISFLMPQTADAFKVFCENNIDLGYTYHALRLDNESADLKKLIDKFNASGNEVSKEVLEGLKDEFRKFSNASAELLASTENPALVNEIKEWLEVFNIIGIKGDIIVEMFENFRGGDTLNFISNYLKFNVLDKAQQRIKARDFKGSIKSPNPKPANEVAAAFISELKNKLLYEYKNKYDYCLNLLPQLAIEPGRYYIKVDGKYLTNEVSAKTVTLVGEKNNTNPQRQEWNVWLDYSTGRFKIESAQDQSFVDENFRIRKDTYSPDFHSFVLDQKDGKYAIQNTKFGGNKVWQVKDGKLERGKNNIEDEDYLFEFERIGK
jgi:beta-N-acetylglucosaminidase.